MKKAKKNTLCMVSGVLGFSSLLLVGLGGCASGSVSGDRAGSVSHADRDTAASGVVMIEGGDAEAVFFAAREVLRDYRFGINRIDASHGVLTSLPKRSVGMASPWDREQSGISQEFEDLVHQQERVVRVQVKETGGGDEGQEGQVAEGAIEVAVEVVVSRLRAPHWRVNTQSIRFSLHAQSRDVNGTPEPSWFFEQVSQDMVFAQRLADEIARRVQ